jgi:hypothetical protein
MTDFMRSLWEAARLYVAAAVAGAILIFVGVEAWRLLEWVSSPVATTSSLGNGSLHDLIIAGIYVVLVGIYVADRSLGHGTLATIYMVLGGLHVLGGTVSLYGLLATVKALIPSLPHYDPIQLTAVAMSILLGVYVLFHRRLNR